LAAHPWCGRDVLVIGTHGDGALHVELADGRRTYLPLAWTDRQPRGVVCVVDGQTIRLTVSALRGLSCWVAARVTERQKLDPRDPVVIKSGDELVERPATAVAVVGQARAPRGQRGARRGTRR